MRPHRTSLLPEIHQASVYLIPSEYFPLKDLLEGLILDEQQRAKRFHFEKDAISWSFYRRTLRQILGGLIGLPPLEVPIIYSEHGKPLLADPWSHIHFNLSHCDQAAVIIVSLDGPVGVDIESFDRAETLLDCEHSFCHPDEVEALPTDLGHLGRALRLLEIWTAKEAALKAIGTGLSQPPEQYLLEGSNNSVTITHPGSSENYPYQIQKLTHDFMDECLIQIAVPSSITSTNLIKISNSLYMRY